MGNYSVLMSVYKNDKPEPFRLALDSMIYQTVKPDEIVLMVDGPVGEHLNAVITEYQDKHQDLFRVVRNEENIGLGLTLQKGVLMCKNELIARMDSDDIARLSRCEKQLACFEHNPSLSIVGGQIQEFQGNADNVIGKRIVPTKNDEIYNYLKKRCPFNHMTVMFKKRAVLESGNYQHLLYNEDYQLWINMAKKKCVFENVDEVLVDVRVDEKTYERRGGETYYKSEKAVQDMMLEAGLIHYGEYAMNLAIRFVLQKMMPNQMRLFVFKLLRK